MDLKQDLLAGGVGPIVDVVASCIGNSDEWLIIESLLAEVAGHCEFFQSTAEGRIASKYLAVALLNQEIMETHTLYSVQADGCVCAVRIDSAAAREQFARCVGV